MTILSNHRVHSYKFTTTRACRGISPKKLALQTTKNNRKSRSPSPHPLADIFSLIKTINPQVLPVTPPSTPVVAPAPAPSAPPAIMTTRKILIKGQEFNIEMPEFFDIYEGLRHWYPNLYEAVLEEDEEIRNNDDIDYNPTEQDIEEMWAHYDYLEWLCD
jgi:hypothetical protein